MNMSINVPASTSATTIKVANVWGNTARVVITVLGVIATLGATFLIVALALPADLGVQDYWLGVGVTLVSILGLTLLYFPFHNAVQYRGTKGAWKFYLIGLGIAVATLVVDILLTNVPTAFKAPWPLLNGVWSALIVILIALGWNLLVWGASRFNKK